MSTRRFRKYQQSLLDAQQPQVEPTGPGILEFLGYKGPTAGSDFVYDQVTPTAEARSAGRAFDAYGKMGRSFREGDYFSGTGYLGTALSESLASIPIAGPVIGLGLTGARSLVKPVVEGVTPFFSKLTNTLTESPQKKGTGKQFLSLLDKKGVKKEEQELTGIRTLLEQNPDRKFTSDELVNTAELNAVELEEVRRGEPLPSDLQEKYRNEAEALDLQEAEDLADEMLPEALEADPNPYDFETQQELFEEHEQNVRDSLVQGIKEDLGSTEGADRHLEYIAEQRGLNYDPTYEEFSTKLEYEDYFQRSDDGDNLREFVLRMPNPEKPEVGYVVKSYYPDSDTGKLESRTFPTYQDAEDKIRMFDRREAEFNRYNNLAKLLDERIAQEKRVNRPDFKSNVYQESYSKEDFDVNAVPSSDLEGMSKVFHGLAKSARDTTFKVEPSVRTKDFNKEVSQVGHFPESNQILHIRTSDEYVNTNLEYSDRSRSKDLYVQEIQSDTAQQGRSGFFDQGKYDEADKDFKEVEEKVRNAGKKVQMLEGKLRQKLPRNDRENERIANAIFKDYRDENAITLMHTPFDLSKEDYVNHYTEKALNYNLMKETESPEFNINNSIQIDDEYKQLLGDYYDAKINQDSLKEPYEELAHKAREERKKPPELPYTSSTEKTNELALKRLLLEAVDGGYDRLTLTSGEAVVDAFGEPGLKTVYDNILPKQLQKIVKKLDPNAKVKRGTSTIPNYKDPYEPSLELQGAPTDAGDEKINYDYSTRTPNNQDMQITVQFDPVRREVNLYDYSLDDKPIKRMDFEDYEEQFLQYTSSYERLEADDPLRSIDNMLANGYELGEADFVEQYLTSTRFRKEAEGSEFYEATILELSPKLKEALKKGLPIMAGAGVTAGLLKEQEKQKGEGLLN
tara:strand:+ start:208 stop:2931 length:2724 start_codon:yes stop_codon:yes gene_type:complete